MLARIGSALFLIGLIFLVVYTVTAQNERASPSTLLMGIVLAALGLFLRRRSTAKEAVSQERFQTVRRLLGKGEEEGD
jgi:uncharacterized membrane protein